MVKLFATMKLRYAKRSLVAGDDFEASEKDAKVLMALGKAKYATATKAYQTRDMTAVTAEAPVNRPTLTLPKKADTDTSDEFVRRSDAVQNMANQTVQIRRGKNIA